MDEHARMSGHKLLPISLNHYSSVQDDCENEDTPNRAPDDSSHALDLSIYTSFSQHIESKLSVVNDFRY